MTEQERIATLEANFAFVKDILVEIKADIRRIDNKMDSLIKWAFPSIMAGLIVITALIKLL